MSNDNNVTIKDLEYAIDCIKQKFTCQEKSFSELLLKTILECDKFQKITIEAVKLVNISVENLEERMSTLKKIVEILEKKVLDLEAPLDIPA